MAQREEIGPGYIEKKELPVSFIVLRSICKSFLLVFASYNINSTRVISCCCCHKAGRQASKKWGVGRMSLRKKKKVEKKALHRIHIITEAGRQAGRQAHRIVEQEENEIDPKETLKKIPVSFLSCHVSTYIHYLLLAGYSCLRHQSEVGMWPDHLGNRPRERR